MSTHVSLPSVRSSLLVFLQSASWKEIPVSAQQLKKDNIEMSMVICSQNNACCNPEVKRTGAVWKTRFFFRSEPF